jgi:hypothetical protein
MWCGIRFGHYIWIYRCSGLCHALGQGEQRVPDHAWGTMKKNPRAQHPWATHIRPNCWVWQLLSDPIIGFGRGQTQLPNPVASGPSDVLSLTRLFEACFVAGAYQPSIIEGSEKLYKRVFFDHDIFLEFIYI